MSYTHILHTYSLLSINTLGQMLKTFVTSLYKYQAIHDTIVRISEYYLMRKYSLVGFHTLILYNVIDGRYVQTVNLSCMSLLVLLYI